jgi:hypothetical protein
MPSPLSNPVRTGHGMSRRIRGLPRLFLVAVLRAEELTGLRLKGTISREEGVVGLQALQGGDLRVGP